MKIYENKILRILGFIFIWIYVFGVGICFAANGMLLEYQELSYWLFG